MTIFRVTSYLNNQLLYEGEFPSLKNCLEQAVTEKVSLAYANLKNANLVNAHLDDALMPYADLSGSNLMGANLSESHLEGANFNHSGLYNTCFAYSDMQRCLFENASLGATDISGSDISHAKFSTLSCFTLDFIHAREMKDCVFKDIEDVITRISQPPIIIHGLDTQPLILMDNHIRMGHQPIDSKMFLKILQCKKFTKKESNAA